jgi:hypothetical protein
MSFNFFQLPEEMQHLIYDKMSESALLQMRGSNYFTYLEVTDALLRRQRLQEKVVPDYAKRFNHFIGQINVAEWLRRSGFSSSYLPVIPTVGYSASSSTSMSEAESSAAHSQFEKATEEFAGSNAKDKNILTNLLKIYRSCLRYFPNGVYSYDYFLELFGALAAVDNKSFYGKVVFSSNKFLEMIFHNGEGLKYYYRFRLLGSIDKVHYSLVHYFAQSEQFRQLLTSAKEQKQEYTTAALLQIEEYAKDSAPLQREQSKIENNMAIMELFAQRAALIEKLNDKQTIGGQADKIRFDLKQLSHKISDLKKKTPLTAISLPLAKLLPSFEQEERVQENEGELPARFASYEEKLQQWPCAAKRTHDQKTIIKHIEILIDIEIENLGDKDISSELREKIDNYQNGGNNSSAEKRTLRC